ncbi:hypothetical protein [Thioclava sp. GXIMD4215]|uniref:hypothetical protein n=1 Tax=Thioclava sp. GXIMD4215 TaxID=3131928 RepID=UPI00324E5862
MVAIHRWFQRGVVPGAYDIALLSGAAKRGIALTADDLLRARSEMVLREECPAGPEN